jgi:separase
MENDAYSEAGYDSGLALYEENLRASIYVSLVLRKENPSAMELKPALAIWASLLNRCDSASSLKERVDDVGDLLAQLQAVADFLDMKGEDSLRLPVLRFIVRLYELKATSISAESYMSNLSELGLQYLRLGYSGKAGLILVKGQESIPKASSSSNAALRLQVSYAEYLLTIGNLEKWLVLIHICILVS